MDFNVEAFLATLFNKQTNNDGEGEPKGEGPRTSVAATVKKGSGSGPASRKKRATASSVAPMEGSSEGQKTEGKDRAKTLKRREDDTHEEEGARAPLASVKAPAGPASWKKSNELKKTLPPRAARSYVTPNGVSSEEQMTARKKAVEKSQRKHVIHNVRLEESDNSESGVLEAISSASGSEKSQGGPSSSSKKLDMVKKTFPSRPTRGEPKGEGPRTSVATVKKGSGSGPASRKKRATASSVAPMEGSSEGQKTEGKDRAKTLKRREDDTHEEEGARAPLASVKAPAGPASWKTSNELKKTLPPRAARSYVTPNGVSSEEQMTARKKAVEKSQRKHVIHNVRLEESDNSEIGVLEIISSASGSEKSQGGPSSSSKKLDMVKKTFPSRPIRGKVSSTKKVATSYDQKTGGKAKESKKRRVMQDDIILEDSDSEIEVLEEMLPSSSKRSKIDASSGSAKAGSSKTQTPHLESAEKPRVRYVGKDVFGNYHMMKGKDVLTILNSVRPNHGLGRVGIKTLTLRINHFLEDLFVMLCEGSEEVYGFVTFQNLKEALINQCLLPENCTAKDLVKSMKDIFPKSDFERSEGILFPSRDARGVRLDDTANYLKY